MDRVIKCLVDPVVLNTSLKNCSNELVLFTLAEDWMIRMYGLNRLKTNIYIKANGGYFNRKISGIRLQLLLFIYYILNYSIVLKLVDDSGDCKYWFVKRRIIKRL